MAIQVTVALLAMVIAVAQGTRYEWQPDNNWAKPENWDGGMLPAENSRVVFPDDACFTGFSSVGATVRMSGNIVVSSIKLPQRGRFKMTPDTRIRLTATPNATDVGWLCKNKTQIDFMCSANWMAVHAVGEAGVEAVRPPCNMDEAVFHPDKAYSVQFPANVYVNQIMAEGELLFEQGTWDAWQSARQNEFQGSEVSIANSACSAGLNCERFCVNSCPELVMNVTARNVELLRESATELSFFNQTMASFDQFVNTNKGGWTNISVNFGFSSSQNETKDKWAATQLTRTIQATIGAFLDNPKHLKFVSCAASGTKSIMCTANLTVSMLESSADWAIILQMGYKMYLQALLSDDPTAANDVKNSLMTQGGPPSSSEYFNKTMFSWNDLSFKELNIPSPFIPPYLMLNIRNSLTLDYAERLFKYVFDDEDSGARQLFFESKLKSYIASYYPISASAITVGNFRYTPADMTMATGVDQAVFHLEAAPGIAEAGIVIYHPVMMTFDAMAVRKYVTEGLFYALGSSMKQSAAQIVANITAVLTPPTQAPDSSSSSGAIAGFLTLPIIVAAAGGIALLVIVVVIIVRRRRGGARQGTSAGAREVVAFENPMYDDAKVRPSGMANQLYASKEAEGLYDEPAMNAEGKTAKMNPLYTDADDGPRQDGGDAGGGYLDVAPE